MTQDLVRFEYLNAAGLNALQHRHKDAASDKIIDWGWTEKHFNRIALVKFLVSQFEDCKYLEIGCENNILFDAIPTKNKIGVDPTCGGAHRMNSDNFFRTNKLIFDIIFIDGLHEYEQVRRDAINAITAISSKG